MPSSLFCALSPWGCWGFPSSPRCPLLRLGARVVAVALVGLLGRVCCPPRHAARGCSRSRYARHSGCRFAPLFFRLPLCFAVGSAWCFPSVRLPEVCHHAAPSDCPPDALILRGLLPPAPPSSRGLWPRCGGDAPFRFGRSAGFFVGGGLSRPALPRAPSWAVFFIVFWAVALCFFNPFFIDVCGVFIDVCGVFVCI